jgi:HPt (histidine-containing phosphotransfer) domain-containing protein
MDGFLTKPVSLNKVRAALTAASGSRRATAPFHPPGESEPADPLATLRLLAARKGVPLVQELDLYLTELESEARLLSESLRLHDSAATADVAHRLVGRLAFVRARAAEEFAREVEMSAVNELWDQTAEASRNLAAELPALRSRLTAVA